MDLFYKRHLGASQWSLTYAYAWTWNGQWPRGDGQGMWHLSEEFKQASSVPITSMGISITSLGEGTCQTCRSFWWIHILNCWKLSLCHLQLRKPSLLNIFARPSRIIAYLKYSCRTWHTISSEEFRRFEGIIVSVIFVQLHITQQLMCLESDLFSH